MRSRARSWAKRAIRAIVGEYSVYRIYRCRRSAELGDEPGQGRGTRIELVDGARIAACSDPTMREQAWYAGPESRAYACFEGDDLVGVCFFWFGERYRERGFLTLHDGEAKLVQVVTAPSCRGRGFAPALIRSASADMFAQGFVTLFARVWFTNEPSRRSFSKAKWEEAGYVVEINPLRASNPLRFQRLKRSL